MAKQYFIDFDNGDLFLKDEERCIAFATLIADHCDHEPEDLEELDRIFKLHSNYPNCIPIGESRVVELEEAESQVSSLRMRLALLEELLAENLQAWEGEEGSVKEEHSDLIERTRCLLNPNPDTCPG